jgi:hypothetical protein
VAVTPDNDTQQPKALERASSRVPAILASLAALAVIGALSISGYALTDLKIFAEQSPLHEAASAPIPDPAVSTMLKDVQSLRQQNAAGLQQNAAALERLVTNSIAQQAYLTRISEQLSLLEKTDALKKAETPVTTSAIPQPKPGSHVVRPSRKEPSRSLKSAGPVSVGGAPLRRHSVPGSIADPDR